MNSFIKSILIPPEPCNDVVRVSHLAILGDPFLNYDIYCVNDMKIKYWREFNFCSTLRYSGYRHWVYKHITGAFFTNFKVLLRLTCHFTPSVKYVPLCSLKTLYLKMKPLLMLLFTIVFFRAPSGNECWADYKFKQMRR